MVPGAIGASLGLSEQLFVIDFRGPAVLDDNVAIDDYRLDIGAAAVFYQRIDGIAHRSIPARVAKGIRPVGVRTIAELFTHLFQ